MNSIERGMKRGASYAFAVAILDAQLTPESGLVPDSLNQMKATPQYFCAWPLPVIWPYHGASARYGN